MECIGIDRKGLPEMKKFSFIIPVYNCAEYLTECVKSVLETEMNYYEIILVNDGSRDNSAQICKSLLETNNSIKYIYQENRGVSAARNRGLSIATGDYVLFLDADDTIDSNQMKKALHIVEENNDIDLAMFGISFDYYYHRNCYRKDKSHYTQNGYIDDWVNIIDELYDVNILSPVWNKVFRRDILIHNHLLFNTEMFLYEDLEFSIRYLAYCNVIYNIPECIYHYRQTEDEGNAGRRLMRIEHLSNIINQIEEAFDQLIEIKNITEQTPKIKSVLLNLYCVLAKEKIATSNRREIANVCYDFRKWLESRNVMISEKNVMMVHKLLNHRIQYFILKRFYIKQRHKIAVWIKSRKLYQKIKM